MIEKDVNIIRDRSIFCNLPVKIRYTGNLVFQYSFIAIVILR